MKPKCRICGCLISVLDIENQDAYRSINPKTKRMAWMHRECHVVENEEQLNWEKYNYERRAST